MDGWMEWSNLYFFIQWRYCSHIAFFVVGFDVMGTEFMFCYGYNHVERLEWIYILKSSGILIPESTMPWHNPNKNHWEQ